MLSILYCPSNMSHHYKFCIFLLEGQIIYQKLKERPDQFITRGFSDPRLVGKELEVEMMFSLGISWFLKPLFQQ